MISIDIELVKRVQKEYEEEIKIQYTNALQKLKNIKPSSTEDCEYLYKCTLLFQSTENFLMLPPDEIEKIAQSLPKVPLIEKENSTKEKPAFEKSSIKKKILNALNYTGLRSDFYPKYFQKIGIKACVYCNSALTVSIETTDREGVEAVKAKFQVDHYYPKADYPILSISLFNLYPSCASCNNVKNNKLVKFNLYSDNVDELSTSTFSFILSPYDKAKYLLNQGAIKVKFIEKQTLSEGVCSFDSTFDITGIYHTQLDIASEIIDKSQLYTNEYKNTLKKSFPKLFLSNEHFDRFILGNFPRVQDIHKRPMAKFMQDIARDLHLID